MSGGFFGSLFGKKAPAPAVAAPVQTNPQQDAAARTRDAIQNLTAKREMVEKRCVPNFALCRVFGRRFRAYFGVPHGC